MFENATVTLSRATDWILMVGQWPVLDLWLKPPRSYGLVIDHTDPDPHRQNRSQACQAV